MANAKAKPALIARIRDEAARETGRAILAALKRNRGHIAKAARELGIGLRTIRGHMRRLGIGPARPGRKPNKKTAKR